MFGDEIAIRGQTLVHDSGQPGRGHGRHRRLRDRRPRRGGTGRDRPEDPGDDPRVGLRQLLLGLRGGRRAPREAGLRPGRPRGARVHVRVLEREGAPQPRDRARRSRSRCASSTSATTWRRSAASSRPSAPSRRPASAAARPMTRQWPTSSSRMDATGSTGSPGSSRGTPCSPSSRSLTASSRAPSSTTPSPSSPTSSTSSRPTGAGTAAAAPGSRRTRPACSGSTDDEVMTLRRAALVHDFGTTVVPNSIWDKPGPLTRSEFDRVELHPMLTEQMLRRSPALAVLSPVACAHHEKCDGSGYHKRVQLQTTTSARASSPPPRSTSG